MNESNKLPILLTDGFFLFPKCRSSLLLKEEQQKVTLFSSWKKYQGKLIVVSSKRKIEKAESLNSFNNFYLSGTIGRIMFSDNSDNIENIFELPLKVQLEGLERVEIIQPEKKDIVWESNYKILNEPELIENDEIKRKIAHYSLDILKEAGLNNFTEKLPYLPIDEPGFFLDFIAQNSSNIEREIKQKILVSLDLKKRLDIFLELLKKTENEQQIKKTTEKQIEDGVKRKLRNQQEVYYLRQKQREIAEKLRKLEGDDSDDEMEKNLQRINSEDFPNYVKEVVKREIKKYKELPPNSAEATVASNYIEWLMSLPWGKSQKSEENEDLTFARQVLEKGFFGLKKVKEKIIEHLAANQRLDKSSWQVICLVGPPGVGKTNSARFIAKATKRKFCYISMGGVQDIAEIRGHRRTYVAAEPGRFIREIRKIGVNDPLLLLDEVDKISNFRGNPYAALLEMLDPNTKFTDDYIALPFDQSRVLFICTANSTEDIPRPILDRMDIIRLPSYTISDKVKIAIKHLIPKALESYKISKKNFIFQSKAIKEIIEHYTREAGVRELNRKIHEIIRKSIVEKKEILTVNAKIISEYLGKQIYDFTKRKDENKPGIVNGLAYTGAGGDILPIEVSYSPGKGNLVLTGNLGEIMKESAKVALDFVKTNHRKFNIDWSILANNDIHLHAPEAAVSKEGPSAGTAIITAILSSLTNQPISPYIAMTGETTLIGYVLAIGGLQEKLAAAEREKLRTVFIPEKNSKDVAEISKEIKKKIEIILVSDYFELWEKILDKNRDEKKLYNNLNNRSLNKTKIQQKQ